MPISRGFPDSSWKTGSTVNPALAVGLLVHLLVTEGLKAHRHESPAEHRAVAFLVREVPVWAKENKCYSCHNNGDAARALFAAKRLGFAVPAEALADTTRWLSKPECWHDNGGGKGPESDKKLARIQFASALSEALDAGALKGASPLGKAAELVAEFQDQNGAWQIDAEGTLGSPATYGTHLATHFAVRTLRRADADRHRDAIERAERWLRQTPSRSTVDVAAVLLSLGRKDKAIRARAFDQLRRSQARSGGWGPFADSRVEPFDTAVALLALNNHADEPGARDLIKRGRDYLLAAQTPDGSWPETTRPPGGESYAQRLSTTAWATLALLATRGTSNRNQE